MIDIKKNEKEVKLFVPGRLGIIGELSDLVSNYLKINKKLIPGNAISVPIDKGIYSTIKKSKKINFKFKKMKHTIELTEEALNNEIENETFYSYVCGTILCIIKKYKVSGIDIVINKMDLPLKKGLSSSAAICLTIVLAYNELYKLKLSDKKIKELAYEGEHTAKSNCGRLDQESIMNKNVSYIKFYSNHARSEVVTVKKDLPLLIVDLNASKDTRIIMNSFKRALSNPIEGDDNLLKIIGQENLILVRGAKNSIIEGDLKRLGNCLNEAQKLLDVAANACKEFISPVVHKILSDTNINENIHGAKSVGSGGDGSVLLVCKNKTTQKKLKKYLKDNYNMKSIAICIKRSKEV